MKRLIGVLLLLGGMAFADGVCRTGFVDAVVNGAKKPVTKATVTVYVYGTTTKATLYGNPALTGTPLDNALNVNGKGEYTYCAAPGQYTEKIAGSGIDTAGYNITLGNSLPGVTTDGASGVNVLGKVQSDSLAVGGSVPAGVMFGFAKTSTATNSGYPSRGMVGTCTQGANDSYCYAALFQTVAPVGLTGWNHNVGVESKIVDHNAATTGDVYGSVVGLELASGTWPGVGHRIEFSDATNWPGQVAVGYATVDGITPVAFEAGASCKSGTCYSARFNFYGLDGGTRNVAPAYILGSPWGDLYLQAGNGGKLFMSGGQFSGDVESRPIGTGTQPSYRHYFTALNADVEVKKSIVVDSTGSFIFDGAVTATGFVGNVTGNVTGNASGTAANVTGVVARANGGTGADTSALPTGCVQYPCVVAKVALTTGRTTAVPLTTLYTPAAAGAYRMCGSVVITATTATGGTVGAPYVSYNNGTATKSPNLGASLTASSAGADNNSGTGSAATCATFVAAAGQSIGYAIPYAATGGTATYSYWFTLEQMQ